MLRLAYRIGRPRTGGVMVRTFARNAGGPWFDSDRVSAIISKLLKILK